MPKPVIRRRRKTANGLNSSSKRFLKKRYNSNFSITRHQNRLVIALKTGVRHLSVNYIKMNFPIQLLMQFQFDNSG